MTARLIVIVLALLLVPAGANAHRKEHGLGDEAERKTFVETIPIEDARGLTVDNFHGSISLRSHRGSDIRMTARRTIRGHELDDIARGREEVSLRIEREGRWIYICVDGPFRDPYDCTEWNQRKRHEPDYTVIYELEIEVPAQLNHELSTIHGDIVVSNVRGDFSVHAVEGEIDVSGAAGSGRVQSVNGPVRVAFDENPTSDSVFGTINGEVNVTFTRDVSADMTFETMNGEILTDFDYTPLSLRPRKVEHHDSSRKSTAWKLELESGIRIADGGPRFRFSTINGNILIRKSR